MRHFADDPEDVAREVLDEGARRIETELRDPPMDDERAQSF